MPTTSPFSLDASHLSNLDISHGVEFFRKLLWAESSRVGIGRHLIEVPSCINVGDGGIDAYIEDANPFEDDLIPKGTTGFQIKASDLKPEQCLLELHKSKNKNLPLKPEVKRILDKGGNYVLVLFASISRVQKQNRYSKIVNELNRLGYHNQVRIYTIEQLVGFAERYVSLVTWVKYEFSQGLPYSAWSERADIKYPGVFVPDEPRIQWINEIREALRNPENICPVFRVVSLSGVGKTRLVFEALDPDDLKNKVIYFPSADQFRSSNIYNTIQTDNSINTILVVDECDSKHHEDFVRAFSSKGKRLALFTLSYEFSRVPPPAKLTTLNPLGTEQIKSLIKAEAKNLPENVVSRLSEFADGYPRIATLLADSYIKTSGSYDDFIRIDDDGLMDRLIGKIELGPEEFKKYKRALTGISLFQKVGYEDSLEEEAKWLSGYMCIDWASFGEAVQYERRRGIIQGVYYIFVTPFMLRVYLLNDWWESFGFTKDTFDKFVESIPDGFRIDLTQRFFEHIPYISTTDRGKKFTKAILGDEGIFRDGELLRSELGGNFFIRLTEADPESALRCLQKTMGKWSKEDLLNFTIGRRQIIWALERIAIWRELFQEAARLLLKLGEAENESWSNNASGVFAELFSPGFGEVATTEASPEERFIILKEALDSTSHEKRELGLRASNQALQSRHFWRMVGNERQGLRRSPNLWQPKTYKELYDSYRKVWILLESKLIDYPGDQQKKAVDILLQNTRGLGIIPHFAGMVIQTLRDLLANGYIEQTQVLTQILDILHYDTKEMLSETKNLWESFQEEVVGNNFSSSMNRYVKMNVLSDKFDENSNHVDIFTPKIRELALQAYNDKSLLTPELPWLATAKAQNGFQFGYELGSLDQENSLLPGLVDAQRNITENTSLFFLSGYFNALFIRDRITWNLNLDKLASDKRTAVWVPELTWRSDLTDDSASRILRLAKEGLITPDQLRIFEYGNGTTQLSESVFQAWIEFLLSVPDGNAASISLGLYYSYYVYADKNSPKKIPDDMTIKVLTNQTLFKDYDPQSPHAMDEFYWTEIDKAFILKYPNKAIELVDPVLVNFGKEGTILSGSHPSSKQILGLIAQIYPKEVWWKLVKYLGPPLDTRAFHLKDWLNGENFAETKRTGALSVFPLEEIYKWVDEDVENRAWYLASFVPKDLFLSDERLCLAREVLIRYGDREDVRRNLVANLSTEGWTGYASDHYQKKKEQLLEFRKSEINEKIIKWLDDYIASIDSSIKDAKKREERNGF